MHRLKPAHQDNLAPQVSIDGILNHRRNPRLLRSVQYLLDWSNQDLIIKDKPPSDAAQPAAAGQSGRFPLSAKLPPRIRVRNLSGSKRKHGPA